MINKPTNLTKVLKEKEYPGLDDNEDNPNDEELNQLKLFKPRFLSTFDWILENTLTIVL